MLMDDRAGYDERLDYFEVNFDAAIATLGWTAAKWRLERRSVDANDLR